MKLPPECCHRRSTLRAEASNLAERLAKHLAATKAGVREQIALQLFGLWVSRVLLEHYGLAEVEDRVTPNVGANRTTADGEADCVRPG